MKINETLDNTLNYSKFMGESGEYSVKFSLSPKTDITVKVIIDHFDDETITAMFRTDGNDKYKLKKGRETYTIFSTISQIVIDHVEEHDIKKIVVVADSMKRADIFEKMFKRFGKDWLVNREGLDVEAFKK
jgi:hypothetical protein